MGSIQVTFFGSVAFVPTNPDQAPMTDGAADSILAILPRAYSAHQINRVTIPDRHEFDPQNAQHVEHHLILKMDPGTLGLSGGDEIAIPIRPPANDRDVYTLSIDGLASAIARPSYAGFGGVAPVYKGTPAALNPSASSRDAVSGPGALARMQLGFGWSLSTGELDRGDTMYLDCGSGNCGPRPTSVESGPFALAVRARCSTAGSVALVIKNGNDLVLRLPLREDPVGSPIEIKILHAPLSEMYGGGNPHQRAMHHFKLYYLQADAIQRPYCYPVLQHLMDTDPFCTPLAQFLPRS
jgi:hypothetical protein